jgi:hypothetical protein
MRDGRIMNKFNTKTCKAKSTDSWGGQLKNNKEGMVNVEITQ